MANDEAPVSDVIDDLSRAGDESVVCAGEVIDAFQHRSLGVLLVMFSLVALTPIVGGIPGVSIITGVLILVVTAQSLIGGKSIWMPNAVRKRKLDRDRFDKGLEISKRWLSWLDKLIKPRIAILAAGTTNRILISIAAAMLAVAFMPLAIIPWGVTVPALGVLAFGLGLMARDGVAVLAGYLFSAATVYVLYATMMGGGA